MGSWLQQIQEPWEAKGIERREGGVREEETIRGEGWGGGRIEGGGGRGLHQATATDII